LSFWKELPVKLVYFAPLFLVAGMTLVGGCPPAPPAPAPAPAEPTPPAPKSLYDRLGGQPAIDKVVGEFVGKAAGDKKVNFTRDGHPNHWDATPENIEKLKKHLAQFVAGATGGPNEYKGKDQATVHKGMEITDAEFDAIAADLQSVLDELKVPAKEAGELMTIVGSTRKDIVGK
jgi:hemoglobin